MLRLVALSLSLLLGTCSAYPAMAACQSCDALGLTTDFTLSGRQKVYAGVKGFCEREAETCRAYTGDVVRVPATDALLALLLRINTAVNAEYVSASDKDIYGEDEYWAYPKSRADCEDYALEKRRRLLAEGVPAGALSLVGVKIKAINEGHAILAVRTDRGLYFLDNQYEGLLTVFSPVGYVYLAIQVPGAFEAFNEINGARM